MTQPQTQRKTRPNYPPPRYAVIVATERYWGVDPRHAYLLGPDAVATLALLQRQGHTRFSLTDVVSWQVGSAPAVARLLHPVEKILSIEADLVSEFLVARGVESRLEPTAKITAEDVLSALTARGATVALADVSAWLQGQGRQYAQSFFDASALPTIAASAATHYLRSYPK